MLECLDDCDNVLTEKGLELLLKLENDLVNLKNYSKFCVMNINENNCSENSLISFTKILKNQSSNPQILDIS